MEQITGMAWVTGFADGPPLIPRGACDPFAGMHAVLALLTAVETRDRTGAGMLVEVTMVEAALNAAAEQVIEHSASGTLLGRHGNRGPVAAPQGLYACAGTERWLALAVVTDEHWDTRSRAWSTGDPDWARTVERRDSHDLVDAELAAWCADRELDDLVEELAARDVPAAPVIVPRDIAENPQMRSRRSSRRSSTRLPAPTSCRGCRSGSRAG